MPKIKTHRSIKINIYVFLLAFIILTTPGVFASDMPDTIEVTGNPAPSWHVSSVVKGLLERAGYSADSIKGIEFKTLSRGKSFSVAIPLLKAENGDEEKAEDITEPKDPEIWDVTITNRFAPDVPCSFLAFSNHPEKVKKPGVLFEAGLLRNRCIRLRYYHHGDPNSPAHWVGVYIMNNTGKEARVHFVETAGGPSRNWTMAGHMNNVKFFNQKEKGIGRYETIPPNSIRPVRKFLLKPDDVISGTADFLVTEGGPLQIVVYASKGREEDLSYSLITDQKDRHARGAYPLTSIHTEDLYVPDEGEKFYTIADTPMENIFEGKKIKGNYGVMYEYDLTLKNPFDEERAVALLFQPRGGIATATFTIDGRTVSVGLTKAYQLVELAKVRIPAKSEKTIKVKTMPEDASNYPIRLILMPVVKNDK